MRSSALLFCSITLACVSGCYRPYPTIRSGVFAKVTARTPLLRDEHLLDPPAQDDSLLGRILPVPYDPTRPLAAQLAPNPCADALVDVEPRPFDAEVEDAASLPSSAGERSPTSYVYYRFKVQKRLEKAKTPAYAACCAKASCGVGYVRGLSFAEGEIARAAPTTAGGRADVALEDDDGAPFEFTLLERRAERGYLAFTLEAPGVTPPEEPATPPPSAKYAAERLEIRELPENPDLFKICSNARCFTENQFVRLYQEQTGSHELDDFVRDRVADARWLGAVFGGVGALATAAGVLTFATANQTDAQKDRDIARVAGGMISGIGLAMLAVGAGFLSSPSDGPPTQHYLTKIQTRRFVERYNRALSRAQ